MISFYISLFGGAKRTGRATNNSRNNNGMEDFHYRQWKRNWTFHAASPPKCRPSDSELGLSRTWRSIRWLIRRMKKTRKPFWRQTMRLIFTNQIYLMRRSFFFLFSRMKITCPFKSIPFMLLCRYEFPVEFHFMVNVSMRKLKFPFRCSYTGSCMPLNLNDSCAIDFSR